MTIARRNKNYYVNSVVINEKALNEIFGEVFKAEYWQELTAKLKAEKEVDVKFGGKYKLAQSYVIDKVFNENRVLRKKLAEISKLIMS